MRSYRRRSAVLFLGGHEDTRDLRSLMVPYPIQDNLFALPKAIATPPLRKSSRAPGQPDTMAAWLRQQFGSTLCRIFFDPFHERYTAGLFREIAPQDGYKSPIDKAQVRRGAEQENTDAGYNATFLYPAPRPGHRQSVAGAALRHQVWDGRHPHRREEPVARAQRRANAPYESLVATAPLNRIVEMAGLERGVGHPIPTPRCWC